MLTLNDILCPFFVLVFFIGYMHLIILTVTCLTWNFVYLICVICPDLSWLWLVVQTIWRHNKNKLLLCCSVVLEVHFTVFLWISLYNFRDKIDLNWYTLQVIIILIEWVENVNNMVHEHSFRKIRQHDRKKIISPKQNLLI